MNKKMDKFEQHINPSRKLELKRDNGEVDVFTLEPLTYEYMPKMFQLLNKLKDLEGMNEEDSNKFLELFDEKTILLLQELELETMKRSYPSEDIKKLKSFVSSNIFNIFVPMIEVNSFGVNNMNDLEVQGKIKQVQIARSNIKKE